MGPIVKELAAANSDKSIDFVTFDFTSDATKAEAKAKAEKLGVAGTYAKNAGKTGFALIYNTKTQEVVKKVTAGDEAAAWQKIIDENLGA